MYGHLIRRNSLQQRGYQPSGTTRMTHPDRVTQTHLVAAHVQQGGCYSEHLLWGYRTFVRTAQYT